MGDAQPLHRRTVVGHPVDVASGIVFTAWDDFTVPGPFPLEWRRFYNTSYLEDGPFGKGWVTPYTVRLRRSDNRLVFLNDDAAEVVLMVPRDGERINHPGLQYETIREGRQYIVYYWHHDERFIFDIVKENQQFRLVRVENLAGHGVDLLYKEDRWTGCRDSAGREYLIQFNVRGQVESITLSPSSKQERAIVLARYEYDGQGRLTVAYDQMGRPMRYAYDDRQRLVKETNRLGGSFYFEYDSSNRCVHCWGDGGYMERRFTYDSESRTTAVESGDGATSKYELNEMGLVIAFTDPLGNTNRRVYDLEGRVTMNIDASLAITTYSYGPGGEATEIVDPNGAKTGYEFDADHRLTGVVNAMGYRWRWKFDARSLLIEETNPMGESWNYKHDARGLLISAEDPAGAVWTLRYDRSANLSELVRPLGGTSIYQCDQLGNFIEAREPSGRIRRWSYNGRGDILSETWEDGTEIRQDFDPDGHLVALREPEGGRWSNRYDRFGQLLEQVGPDGTGVRYNYDTEGRTTSIINQNGDTASFEYDAAGRVIRELGFDGRERILRYGVRGEVIGITEADGQETSFEFDSMRFLRRMAGPTQEIQYEYDELGRLIQARAGGHIVEYDYDASEEPIAAKSDGLAVTYKRQYGRCAATTFPDGYHVAYEYDLEGRVTAIRTPSQLHEFAWDATGCMIEHRRPSGLSSRFHWSPGRRLQSHSLVRRDGKEVLNQEYSYNRNGDLTDMRDSRLGAFAYKLDEAGLVRRVSYPANASEEVGYDGAGNITSRTLQGQAAVAAGNRLASMGSSRFSYDAKGNTTRIANGQAWLNLTYDDFSRLIQTDDQDDQKARFHYDPMGRRIAKDSGERHGYLWDGNRLGQETSGGSTTRYLYLPDSDEPISMEIDDQVFDLITDPGGFPNHVADTRGDLVWSGWRRLWGDGLQSDRPSPHRLGFLGQFLDAETGLYYNYARYYSAETGRYLTQDPIGIIGGLNLYSYVPNPLRYVDPLGLRCQGIYEDAQTKRMRVRMPPGDDTVHGALRDPKVFWRAYAARDAGNNPPHLSPANLRRIQNGRSPRVDAHWVAAHPMDSSYRGQTLVHHHEHQRRNTVAIPNGMHRSNHAALHPDRRS